LAQDAPSSKLRMEGVSEGPVERIDRGARQAERRDRIDHDGLDSGHGQIQDPLWGQRCDEAQQITEWKSQKNTAAGRDPGRCAKRNRIQNKASPFNCRPRHRNVVATCTSNPAARAAMRAIGSDCRRQRPHPRGPHRAGERGRRGGRVAAQDG